jgi:protein-disulfide isomerase
VVVASKTKKRQQKRAHVPPSPARRTTRAHARPSRPAAAEAPQAKTQDTRGLGSLSPRQIYAYAVGLALVVAALLIGLSQISAHRGTKVSQPAPTVAVPGAAESAALLNGIPQQGNVLGSPDAPVRLIEYADPQCPYCAQYAVSVMPTLIRDYVRPGKVQLEFRGLGFLGPDSGTALATAAAAGLQNRFWNVIDLLYLNQGTENSGWVTDSLLRSIVTSAGADADRVFADRTSSGVTSTINGWSTQAQTAGVNSVPNFFYGRRGGPLTPLSLSAIAVPELRAALDRALQG